MPNQITYRPTIIDGLITHDRIYSYQSVFQPKNDVELVGVYLWNSHVISALYPLVSAAEISLRNAVDGALKAEMGPFWWVSPKLICNSWKPGQLTPMLSELQDGFAEASRKYVSDQRRRYQKHSATPSHHGVVAKTDFSIWEQLLNHDFLGRGLIWPKHLGTVFAGPWTNTHAGTFLTETRNLVSTVRDFRNRLFHHEPAWKRFGVMSDADAISSACVRSP
jgi:hypothetical protein